MKKSIIIRAVAVALTLGGLFLGMSAFAAHDPSPSSRFPRPQALVEADGWSLTGASSSWIRTLRLAFGSAAVAAHYHHGHAVLATNDGGAVVSGVGGFNSASWEGEDLAVLRIRPTGDVVWQLGYDPLTGETYNVGPALVPAKDGGYLVAGWTGETYDTYGRAFALKLSATGAVKWFRTYGGDLNDRAFAVQPTGGGAYLVAGETESFNSSGTDAWVFKLNSLGNIVWQRAFGGPADEHLYSIVKMPDGGFLAAGSIETWPTRQAWVVRLTGTGGIKWQRMYGDASTDWDEARSLCLTGDGGCLVAGSRGVVDPDTGAPVWSDIRLWKLDKQGRVVWQKAYRFNSVNQGRSVIRAQGGGFLLAGSNLVLRLSPTGDIIWQRAFGDQATDAISFESAAQAKNEAFLLTGSKGSDMLIVSLGPDGSGSASCPLILDVSVSLNVPAAWATPTFFKPRSTSARALRVLNPDFALANQVETVCDY
jgi:hypothetical protein